MNRLIINESPKVFQPSLAMVLGLNEAIFVQQLHFWINYSQHLYEGRRWIYKTRAEWQQELPFWSIRTLDRIISKLKTDNILLTGNFNKYTIDHTLWYTLNYTELDKLADKYFEQKDIEEAQSEITTPDSPPGLENQPLRQNVAIELTDPSQCCQNVAIGTTKSQSNMLPKCRNDSSRQNVAINTNRKNKSRIQPTEEKQPVDNSDEETENPILEALLAEAKKVGIARTTLERLASDHRTRFLPALISTLEFYSTGKLRNPTGFLIHALSRSSPGSTCSNPTGESSASAIHPNQPQPAYPPRRDPGTMQILNLLRPDSPIRNALMGGSPDE